MIPKIQPHPTAQIWDGQGGIADELGRVIWDERGRALRNDRGQASGPVTTGLVAWYKADALTLANGDPVNPWPDSGPNGNDLGLTGTTPPSFVAGPPQLVRWNTPSENTELVRASGVGGAPVLGGARTGCSWFYVGRRTAAGSFAALATFTPSFLTQDGSMRETISGSTVTLHLDGVTPDLTITLGDWQVFSLTYDETENLQTFYINSATATGPIAGGGAGFIPIDAIQLQHNVGEVEELLVYRQKLSADDVATNRQYLSAKYGIAISV